MDAGAAGGDEHHVALAGGDQGRGIEDGGDAHLRGSPGAGPEAQLEGDTGAVRAHDTVDFVRGDAGVGQCAQRPEERDGGRVVLGQDPACTVLWTPTMATPAKGWRRHGAYSRIHHAAAADRFRARRGPDGRPPRLTLPRLACAAAESGSGSDGRGSGGWEERGPLVGRVASMRRRYRRCWHPVFARRPRRRRSWSVPVPHPAGSEPGADRLATLPEGRRATSAERCGSPWTTSHPSRGAVNAGGDGASRPAEQGRHRVQSRADRARAAT